jgi:GGDEF domain-containing protein
MEEWQLKQAKNAQLLRTAMHDPFTGLANRAFRNSIAALMNDISAKQTLPCSSSTVIILSLLMTPGDMRQATAC